MNVVLKHKLSSFKSSKYSKLGINSRALSSRSSEKHIHFINFAFLQFKTVFKKKNQSCLNLLEICNL